MRRKTFLSSLSGMRLLSQAELAELAEVRRRLGLVLFVASLQPLMVGLVLDRLEPWGILALFGLGWVGAMLWVL